MFHIQACKLRLFRLKAMRNTLFLAFYFFKENFFPVKHGIGEMGNPVAGVNVVTVGLKFKVEG